MTYPPSCAPPPASSRLHSLPLTRVPWPACRASQCFDTNGDGKVSLEEFEKNLKPRTREKIEALLDAGWKFDAKLWLESQERHKDDPPYDLTKVGSPP